MSDAEKALRAARDFNSTTSTFIVTQYLLEKPLPDQDYGRSPAGGI